MDDSEIHPEFWGGFWWDFLGSQYSQWWYRQSCRIFDTVINMMIWQDGIKSLGDGDEPWGVTHAESKSTTRVLMRYVWETTHGWIHLHHHRISHLQWIKMTREWNNTGSIPRSAYYYFFPDAVVCTVRVRTANVSWDTCFNFRIIRQQIVLLFFKGWKDMGRRREDRGTYALG